MTDADPAADPSPDAPAGDPSVEDVPAERPGLDDRERTLDPRVVRVWRVGAAIPLVLLILPAISLALALLQWLGAVVIAAGLSLLAFAAGWYPRARYEAWRWRLTPLALELRHGVLVRRHQAVPYFRIQQIDISQGPLDRWLDLASLQVTTASGSGSAALPGIPADEAPTVREELLARAAAALGQHRDEISDAV